MKRDAKAPRRIGIFGRAPVLDAESETSYWELHEHMFGALEPADIVDEFWAREAVDAAWDIKRLRHARSVILSAKMTAAITRKASSIVDAGPELNSGTEEQRQEMTKFLNPNSTFAWKTRKARYPRAAAKYDGLLEAARLTLDLAEIQAEIVLAHVETIERLEALIMIAERRFDSIIREFDRRRMMRELRHRLHKPKKANIKTIELIGGNTKIA